MNLGGTNGGGCGLTASVDSAIQRLGDLDFSIDHQITKSPNRRMIRF